VARTRAAFYQVTRAPVKIVVDSQIKSSKYIVMTQSGPKDLRRMRHPEHRGAASPHSPFLQESGGAMEVGSGMAPPVRRPIEGETGALGFLFDFILRLHSLTFADETLQSMDHYGPPKRRYQLDYSRCGQYKTGHSQNPA
jgi:hypothetical protein